ncbi:ArsR/SmtB family transcription factor [Halomicrococcus sp. NG-SE-24]|uniref:ArsR/SmtB family transcription factor n=1 Tax=Halomicrococcus sp. NG-SE-24 TaxID=3436928 RepID=UPI003D96C9DA
MVDFLPSSVDPGDAADRDPRVVGVDSEDADDLMAALSSDTSRKVLAALYEEPASPAALADRVDTSLQNVQYHLGKLEDGDLVEVVDTVYSEKGREMDVYGPAAEPLVLFAGNEERTVGLRSALTNLLGGVGVLGLASLVVQRLSTGELLPFGATSNGGGDGAPVDYDGGSNAADGGANSTTESPGTAFGANDSGGTEVSTTVDSSRPGETVTVSVDTAESTTSAATTTTAEQVRTTADAASTAATDVARTTTEAVTTVGSDGAAAVAGLPPGLVFFAGGALVLLLGFAVWYARARPGQV